MMNICVTILNFMLASENEASTLKARADVQLAYRNDKKLLTIKDVKVIQGKNGVFVSLPALKRGQRYISTCTIDNAELLQEIEKQLLGQYMVAINRKPGGPSL